VHFVGPIVCARDGGTCASIGALVVGLRYRRRAGVGTSSRFGGLRSSVNGTGGSIDIIDLVRKSSGVIIGALRAESDMAADFKAFKEAVKFDLKKTDFRRVGSKSSTAVSSCSWNFGDLSKTLKSSSSKSKADLESGWSSTELPSGDDRECSLRAGPGLLPRGEGLVREFRESEDPLIEPSSKDGIESQDVVLPNANDAFIDSLSNWSSCSSSSGGLSRTSNGLLPKDRLNSFSDTSV
jgi:hypothetical protein